MRHTLVLLCLTLMIDPAHVKKIIDGDTFILYHVGVPAEERVRVLAVNTPERGQPLFTEARDFTDLWLHAGPFEVSTCRRDSFGRLLAIVSRGERVLALDLIAAGLGK